MTAQKGEGSAQHCLEHHTQRCPISGAAQVAMPDIPPQRCAASFNAMSFAVLSFNDESTLLDVVDDDDQLLTGEFVSASGSTPVLGLVDEQVIIINYGGDRARYQMRVRA